MHFLLLTSIQASQSCLQNQAAAPQSAGYGQHTSCSEMNVVGTVLYGRDCPNYKVHSLLFYTLNTATLTYFLLSLPPRPLSKNHYPPDQAPTLASA